MSALSPVTSHQSLGAALRFGSFRDGRILPNILRRPEVGKPCAWAMHLQISKGTVSSYGPETCEGGGGVGALDHTLI